MKEHAFNSKYRRNPWRVAAAEREPARFELDENPPVASVLTPIDFDFASMDWETVHGTTEYVLYLRR